jgi:hypothetical protein
MTDALFNIGTHLYNLDDPPTAVSLYGGPILGTIVSITVYQNTVDSTTGVLPKFSPLATIVASPTQFGDLCRALNGGPSCTLCITYDVVNGRREVQGISVHAPVLAKIEREVTRTADTTHEIYEVVSTGINQLLREAVRTNELLADRLPLAPLGPNGGGTSTSPPPLDDCEEPEPAH